MNDGHKERILQSVIIPSETEVLILLQYDPFPRTQAWRKEVMVSGQWETTAASAV